MTIPRLGLSLMPTDDFRRAALPLFAEGQVEAIEWGPDVRYASGIPSWYGGLLDHYADAGALYAHGVHYSALSGPTGPHHDRWLAVVVEALAERPHVHLTEHCGFMIAPGFDRGAPLPLPPDGAVLAQGRARLQRLADAVQIPVGLENLATALSPADVDGHGALLEALTAHPGGFVLLDLHNLWCHAHNFGRDPIALLESFPLDRVRELHVSGGSWTLLPSGRRFRRDTHDGTVPEEVLALVRAALDRCPNVEVVILERMGGTFADRADEATLRADFAALRRCVDALYGAVGSAPRTPRKQRCLTPTGSSPSNSRDSPAASGGSDPVSRVRPRARAGDAEAHGGEIASFQADLLDLLHRGVGLEALQRELRSRHGAAFAAWVDGFDEDAHWIAKLIVRRWARREEPGGADENDRPKTPER